MDRRRFLSTLGALALAAPSASAQSASPSTAPASRAELARLAGRCVLAGYRRATLPRALANRVAEGALGGVILARENVGTEAGLRQTTERLQSLVPRGDLPVLVAADQEGGPVAHLAPPLPLTPSLSTLGAIDDLELSDRVGAALGETLRAVGVNMDLAPVLDVRTNRANMVVWGRVFGADPALVARHGERFIRALQGTGVLACAKHFPGHGDTREDSHSALPRVPHGRERLDAVELVPFRAVAREVAAVMVAHVVYEGVDRLRPATLSRPCAHELLRDHLGFTGVAVSDDLEMAPIRNTHGVPRAAVQAMRAGCDLLTIAHNVDLAEAAVAEMAREAERSPEFRARLEEAAGRVDAARRRLSARVPPNPYREDPQRVLREVAARQRGRGPAYRDPTLPRSP